MPRIDAYLVANARFHDTDFARLELLKLLHEDDDVRVRVAESFADTEGVRAADILVTYTCDLRPEPEEEEALRAFVEGGGRWVALHATNALLDFGPEGIIAPRICDTFMETLGSRFISH
ncbi:MAG: ThuA domain-containing protein, partial [Dehalococcoidia bacterium]|nr:ThuA domain-containing protein [Dehalococcoidia bacterium]